MNYKLMLRTLGRTLQLEALCLLLPLVVCLIYREDPKPFLYTIGLVGLLGSLLVRLRARPDFFSREGPFDIPQLREIMSYDELELDKLGDEKSALFFLIRSEEHTSELQSH